ncbi:helix-turn-helix domain-containing protein [Candidatus Poriferisocius sp.]|uniref:helix-turn-helix domain-containing protein n=2 Tax=Candidatus Poriferisocius sp. TaxID=3101276 RepID=UPI003B0178E2
MISPLAKRGGTQLAVPRKVSNAQRSEGCLGMAKPDGRERLMTVAEVAALMRVSTMTVYRLIKARDLPAVRIGKSYRLREGDVDRYLASRYTQAG